MAANDNVRELREEFNQAARQQAVLTGGGGPGHNDGMDARLTALETRFDTVLPTLATRADVAEVRGDIQRGINETHKWMIATVVGLFLGFGGLFLAMSNALKPTAQTTSATTPPVIINVPSPAPAPAAKP